MSGWVCSPSYLPRPAARPGRCLFGGENVVAHLPNLLPPAGPNRDAFAATGGILFASVISISSVCSSLRSVSGIVIVWILDGWDYRKIGYFFKSLLFLASLRLGNTTSTWAVLARSLWSDVIGLPDPVFFFTSEFFFVGEMWWEGRAVGHRRSKARDKV